ncbi:MAG: DinB family protein [Acidobacteriota bacterium]
MNSLPAPIVQLYGVSSGLYQKAVDGLSRKELLARCGENSNPIIWLAGHLAYSRCGIITLAGAPRELPWIKLFGRGSQVADIENYPDISEILTVWDDVTPALMRRFEELSDAELGAPAPRKFPIEDGSLGGALTFLAYHEAYHVGQMAYIRKWLGHGGMVG